MKVIPDSTHRIVLTTEMRAALGFRPGDPLEVSISPGAILLSPAPVKGNVIKKGKLKVFDGKVPDVEITEAIRRARR